MSLNWDAMNLHQAKKAQGETNQRLDALLAAQHTTNQWLAHIAAMMEAQMRAAQRV